MLIFTLQKSQKEKEKGPEKIFEDIRPENILNLGKETHKYKKHRESHCSINPERNTP